MGTEVKNNGVLMQWPVRAGVWSAEVNPGGSRRFNKRSSGPGDIGGAAPGGRAVRLFGGLWGWGGSGPGGGGAGDNGLGQVPAKVAQPFKGGKSRNGPRTGEGPGGFPGHAAPGGGAPAPPPRRSARRQRRPCAHMLSPGSHGMLHAKPSHRPPAQARDQITQHIGARRERSAEFTHHIGRFDGLLSMRRI